MAIDVLGSDWHAVLRATLAQTRESLFICSPYVTVEGCELIKNSLSPSFNRNGRLAVLSDLSPINLIQAATDPRALNSLLRAFERSVLTHLPRVHAKVFVFDRSYAVVTSANLTAGGLFRNYECGLRVTDGAVVSRLYDELASLASLGAVVSPLQLSRYCDLAEQVQREVSAQLRSVVRTARMRLSRAIRETENELVRWRSAGGRVTPLFAQTIVYLLERCGPLATRELHPLIKELHPDLCDDNVDRVIDGVHYGMKWKHWARSAQSSLKSRGTIVRVDGKWQLSGSPPGGST